MYYIYMVRCEDNSIYTGIATNIERRINEHVKGLGAKYTRNHHVIKLECTWETNTKSNASKLEYYIKQLTKKQKEEIINSKSIELLNDKIETKNYKIRSNMKDISIKNEYGNFKLRVSAIIIQNNKVLVEKRKKGIGYSFPGGHVELGEICTEAIKREVLEELQINTEIEKLFCILENIYKDENKTSQEINYYYKLKPLTQLPNDNWELTEIDNGKKITHYYEWLSINDLNEEIIVPNAIARLIKEDINQSNTIYVEDQR